MLRWMIVLAVVTTLTGSRTATAQFEQQADVAVYGATPAGIAAAIAAGESGRRVLLIEATGRIGGLVTNGLSHSDFRTFEGLNGTFLDFTRRVESYYAQKYGKDSPQVRDCFRGTHGEPHVNLLVFEKMLSEQPTIELRQPFRLDDVCVEGRAGMQRIIRARFRSRDGEVLEVRARCWIDATYEGDLMAAAGVAYRVGREGRGEYGEPLAPEAADGQVQGYNFRLIMTREVANRVEPVAPNGYRREDFLPVLDLLRAGRFESVFRYPSGGIYKAHLPKLPNEKYDINDVSRGLIRLSLPDINDAWPDGDPATRQRLFDEHMRHNVGLLYFLQNDPDVPERFRKEARQWGWCRDELVESGHLPEQLYVREARRMLGRHVFTEHDTDPAPGDARSVLHSDAIAMGDYGPNCHGTAHEGPRFGGKHTGEFYKPVAPYQVPYGVLVPRECANLLVPVACSSSHVGFCALRLEPIWTSLGQAAGVAAHLALDGAIPVQDVSPAEMQRILHSRGAATIYVSDVLPGSPDFAAVQWWGTHGGLHGMSAAPEKPGQRGPQIVGQYYEAYPQHAAELDRALDASLRERWLRLAGQLGLAPEQLDRAATRGEFIRRALALAEQSR